MSKLKLRRLELRAVTPAGLFGTHIEFGDGLCVLHADNSMGKSTCIQSIIYALGLEQMLSASNAVPLPHAMTHELTDNQKEPHKVLESSVLLEISNADDKVITVQRAVVANSAEHRRLIKTWSGPKLTNPQATYERRDYFVRSDGAAQRVDGFHNMLTKFLGWELPLVARYQGGPAPLYLECIFPLLVVEQKRGWSGIQGQLPTHFQIREVGKRAIEFVVDLEEHKNALARQALEQDVASIKSDWAAAYQTYLSAAQSIGGAVVDYPQQPVSDWPPAAPPQIIVFSGNVQRNIDLEIRDTEDELSRVENEEIPRVEQVAEQLTNSLARAKIEVAELDDLEERLAEEIDLENAQIIAIDERLKALREDLQRNKDTRRLREYGSALGMSTSRGTCPSCHQSIKDSLLEQSIAPMSLDENIVLVTEQIQTFESMRNDAVRVLKTKKRHLDAVTARLTERRGYLRSLKRSVASRGDAPSEAAIRQRLQLEERVGRLRRARALAESALGKASEAAWRWRSAQERLKQLSATGLSKHDEEKLDKLEKIFVNQLVDYGFSSIEPRSLRISRSTYRPEHDGFDLGFDLSASDLIRTMWAYLYGLLELSRSTRTNHPGLLILDEPRQQETRHVSFAVFLKRAAGVANFGQQVVFSTSEDINTLLRALEDVPHKFIGYSGRVLQPLERPPLDS